MVYTAVFWRNMFALKGCISKTQSPSECILNRKFNFSAHYKLEEHNNTMQSRTIGVISTRHSNNGWGYCFVSLSTG